MIGTLTKLFVYRKAPMLALTLLHPRTTARLAKTRWDFRHAAAPRIAAAGAALGMAALALPLGIVLGRRGRSDRASA